MASNFEVPIEGFYVETPEGLLFSVKGIHHPEGLVIAYLRYVPDPKGDRTRDRRRFRRVYDLDETQGYLGANVPAYLNDIRSKELILQSIPRERITRVYDPTEKTRSIIRHPENRLELETAKLVSSISTEGGVPVSRIGVSGSPLIDLAKPTSDIDLVIYGVEYGRKAFDAVRKMRARADWVNPYTLQDVVPIATERWKDPDLVKLSLEAEVGKSLHGKVDETDYFIRLVPDPPEHRREIKSKPLGKVTLNVKVLDAGMSIFTPCTYIVDECSYVEPSSGPEVTQLASYRGRFTEQASEGEVVEVHGSLEEVTYPGETVHRIMLGDTMDYVVPAAFSDR
jgi:predicted nucleotidyltransferase